MTDIDPADIPEPDPAAFERIAALITQRTGIRLRPGKEYFVAARLGRLLRTLGCDGWGELCNRLEEPGGGAAEEWLVDAVVTGETQFFRDEHPFRALRETVRPEALGDDAGRPVYRVWSAGCSTGQEPYSVAMCLWDQVQARRMELDVWATDICAASLRRARAAVYDSFELVRGLPPEARGRFFEELPGGRARVREEIRQVVRFEQHNLIAPKFGAEGFHAVLCRNVAIYFDRAGKRRLYDLLGRAVRPGGYLILGAAETLLPGLPGFSTLYFGSCLLFRKTIEGPP